ncbi:MAG: patatin-like phospholipase family protein [Verrucomicrobiota bacterium]
MKILQIALPFAIVLAGGCASMKRLPPPDDAMAMAAIPGFPNCRMWGDDSPADEAQRTQRLKEQIQSDPEYDPEAPVHFLAISGGAQEGAFGAGLLAGWSASGTRPEFRVVTGVSSGAMLAPFAFLGPDYDQDCQALFSDYSTKEIVNKRIFSALFRGASLTDNKKLRAILESHFTPVEMEKVAKEYARGRKLFIGSTNLDSTRPVIWDIGAIAASGHPGAYDLIIDVILSSAAFPGVFPPMLFDVEKDGKKFQELHADGGLTTQVFVFPINYNVRHTLHEVGLKGPSHVYVLRNAMLWPRLKAVKPRTLPILEKTAFSLVNAMALMDIHHIYQEAVDNEIEYHLAYMPSDFRDPDEPFDPSYMKELFTLAREQAKGGYPWDAKPPEFQQRRCSGGSQSRWRF